MTCPGDAKAVTTLAEELRLFVNSSDAALQAETLRSFCRAQLTADKVLKFIVFVPELPKSNMGKILRRKLGGLNPSGRAGEQCVYG